MWARDAGRQPKAAVLFPHTFLLLSNGVLGLPWDVVFWQVEEEFGSIMDLFQETGNQKNMLVNGDSRLEIIMKMHGAAKRGIAKLGLDATEAMQEEMWVRVKRDAMRSNHSYKEEIADLVDFVRNLSGGVVEPIYIYYLRNFIRTLKVER